MIIMSPDEFFGVITHVDNGKRGDEKLMKLSKVATFSDVPKIFVDQHGRVSSFDGRHRMEILKARGHYKIPVLICGPLPAYLQVVV